MHTKNTYTHKHIHTHIKINIHKTFDCLFIQPGLIEGTPH